MSPQEDVARRDAQWLTDTTVPIERRSLGRGLAALRVMHGAENVRYLPQLGRQTLSLNCPTY